MSDIDALMYRCFMRLGRKKSEISLRVVSTHAYMSSQVYRGSPSQRFTFRVGGILNSPRRRIQVRKLRPRQLLQQTWIPEKRSVCVR